MKLTESLLTKSGAVVLLGALPLWWVDTRFLPSQRLTPEEVALFFVQYALRGWTEDIERGADDLLTESYQSGGWPIMRVEADACANEVRVNDLVVSRPITHRQQTPGTATALVEVAATDIFFPEQADTMRDLKFPVSLVVVDLRTTLLRRPYRRWRVNFVKYDAM